MTLSDVVGKNLQFTLKENGNEGFSTVSTVCATTVKNHTDDVSAKIQVPQAKKNLVFLVRAILPFYMNGFRR